MTASVSKYSKFHDERGSLYTIYNRDYCTNDFILDKVSVSKLGTIRGFHGDDNTWKLMSCLWGTLMLVVYDIDAGIKEEFLLSANDEEHISILVPPRHLNAHQCLSSECVLHYKWDAPYDLSNQYSVLYNDETIGASWAPIPAVLSERDEVSRKFKDAFSYNRESKPTYIAPERH